MKCMNAEAVRAMLMFTAQRIIESKDRLTRIDSAIGDGDHGIGMAGGMERVCEALSALDPLPDAYGVFSAAGRAMLMSMGGASGVIFASLYLEGAKGCGGDTLSPTELAELFHRSLRGIQKRGGAEVGDKTMVDALAPAVDAMLAYQGQSFADMFSAAKSAAQAGAESTKGMVARFGRAKSLGERAIGHQDAGATSVAVMMEAMYDYCKSAA